MPTIGDGHVCRKVADGREMEVCTLSGKVVAGRQSEGASYRGRWPLPDKRGRKLSGKVA